MKRTFGIVLGGGLLVAAAIYLSRADSSASASGVSRSSTAKRPTDKKVASPAARKSADKPAEAPPSSKRAVQRRPTIDIALALDTSGSMSGLINAARQKLWDIVGEAARAQPTPRLRVALVTYGSAGSERDGYVVVRADLTSDLDAIYAKLFELTTAGGTEYVGRVIARSVNELSWSTRPNALRQIYVAGNESADQDRTMTARRAVRLARGRDVFVNAIYCGSRTNHDASSWRRVAAVGRGMFAAIDHNRGTVAIRTPYDAKLGALSGRLNTTYIPYGGRRARLKARSQVAQDKNAQRFDGSAASRAVAKASGVYRNDDWDLLDARLEGKKVRDKDLPSKLRAMAPPKRDAHLRRVAATRARLKRQIRALGAKRRGYIATEMKRKGLSDASSFDAAVRKAMREQATAKGIHMK